MIPVRIVVETESASVEYIVHVVNRSKHALRGAVRAGWRRFPAAKSVAAEFTHHACASCKQSHPVQPIRRTFRRVRETA